MGEWWSGRAGKGTALVRYSCVPRMRSPPLAIFNRLAAESWHTPRPLRVRMALHTGEADLRAGDYYGSDVNRCARLRAVACGGQTLLSQATFDLVRDALPPQVTLRDLGEH